jgi:hypothetical protein
VKIRSLRLLVGCGEAPWIAIPSALEETPRERVTERTRRPGREAVEALLQRPPGIAIERRFG